MCSRCIAAAAVVAMALVVRPALGERPRSAAELVADYQRLSTQYRSDVEHLSHIAYAREWSQLGDMAHRWRPEPPASGLLLFVAPDPYGPDWPTPPAEMTADAATWWGQWDELRCKQGDALFALAREAADAGQLSLALTWATEAVRENPDHADARRVLGHEQHDGQWLTPYAARMADAGKRWHPHFGWIAEEDVSRYEAGERFEDGQWITAEVDAARHARLEDGWQLRTDHFLVTTNHSLEAAAELAARLERLHQVWQQLFAGFNLSEREVRQLLSGQRQARKRSRPFRVFYHRDRDQYVASLVRRQPRIAETLGIYFDALHEAHFFAGDDQDAGTLYHEAVHQLFQESRPATRRLGRFQNFWILEGIATYFETLAEHGEPEMGRYYTVGQSSAGRLPSARRRLVDDGFYLPLGRFVRLGKSDLQRHADIAKLYSQGAGLAAFLMQGEDGRYREPLVRYLTAVYGGRDDDRTLARLTGRSYRDLDAEYRRFLESLP